MAWSRPGDKPLTEPMMIELPTHICVTRPQWVKRDYWMLPVCISLAYRQPRSIYTEPALEGLWEQAARYDQTTWVNASHVSATKWFFHDDVIQWKHFPRYWPFVRGIHRSLVNSAHKGQWRRALIFSLICAWITVEETIVRLVIGDAIGFFMTSL